MSTTNSDKQAWLRGLPSVAALLEHEDVQDWLNGLPRSAVVAALQDALELLREDILSGRRAGPVGVEDILQQAESDVVERMSPSLQAVINATGIVLHTGLGRAPLCDTAMEAIMEAASGYCNLEYDLATGQRGRRQDHVVELLCDITGAEAATVVNNNAAATLIVLQTLAAGREAIVSRGQLIEIGGSYRLPDIMSASGATLREVGTTNRTRLSDYENAIDDNSAMLMRVHTSNYRVVGFTEETPIGPMAELAHRHGLLAFDDLGSGALIDLEAYGLPAEPWVGASLEAGADVVAFSGDKLLGGPQCGILLGKRELIRAIEKNPLMRTHRVDKLTLLALEATLRHYLEADEAMEQIPALAMLSADAEELAERARVLSEQLHDALPGESFYVCSDVSYAGGGTLPAREMPTVVVKWKPASLSPDVVARDLRTADRPVIVRIKDDSICFDLRTLRTMNFEPLIESVAQTVLERDEDADDSDDVRLPLL